MLKKSFKVVSDSAMNARVSAILVNEANKYSSESFLEIKNKKINLKSIMGVMSLELLFGDIISLSVDGGDEPQAFLSLTESIITNKIGREI